MGGCACEDDYEFISPRTLVLVGKTGTGKSSTGNSILRMKVLLSKRSSSGVTVSSELQATTLEDGQLLNIIDTPGLFDPSLSFEFIGMEIVKCISMAPDGSDAFLAVVSTLTRFSEEESAAIRSLQTLFGGKVYDYMIVVFTGGDELEEDNQTLKNFLSDSPESLKVVRYLRYNRMDFEGTEIRIIKRINLDNSNFNSLEILGLCGNRCLLFDNKTKDEKKKTIQVKNLLSLVDVVSVKNDGKRYTNEIFTEMKNHTMEVKEEGISLDDEKIKHVYEMVESKLKETTTKLEKQLAEEGAACLKAEKKAKAAEKKLAEEKVKVKESLKKSKKMKKQMEAHWQQREADIRRAHVPVVGGCFIL